MGEFTSPATAVPLEQTMLRPIGIQWHLTDAGGRSWVPCSAPGNEVLGVGQQVDAVARTITQGARHRQARAKRWCSRGGRPWL